MNPRLKTQQRGFLLVTVLILLTLLAATALLLSSGASMDLASLRQHSDDAELDYVAEAGMAHALWRLSQNTSCAAYTGMPATSFGAHSYATTVTPASGSPVTLVVDATLNNGPGRTRSQTNVRAYQAPALLVLQPAANEGKDTYVYEWQAARNFGASVDLRVENRYANSWSNALLEFDLSSIGAGSKIISAKLDLYQNAAAAGGGTFSVHRVTQDWTEGSMTGNNGAPNWTQRNPGTNWTTNGGDYDPAAVSTTTIPAGTGWHQWELADLVQPWVSGKNANLGMALVPASFGSNAFFSSSDASDPGLRPTLSVTYACECGKVCAAGGASGSLLMVVGDKTNPATQDTGKKALIESWGYTVTLIDDGASQAAFNAALASADVAYVSATVSDSTLASKLVDTGKGVLNEKPALVDEFGFSSDNAGANRTQIDIGNNSHYITSVFPLGLLTIHSSSQPTYMLTGTYAPGLVSLATGQSGVGWTPVLATLDIGASIVGGGSAAGRRVKLPWGGTAFSHGLMNADGRTIMRRAIEWAAMPPDAGAPNRLLFVVGQEGSLTAAEAAHRSLVESWGYLVTTIDDDASQAEFDAAVAGSDVVYTTNDITASRLGTKLVDAVIGVVTSEDNLSDEFGLAASIAWDSGTTIDIDNNTHYITAPFALGQIAVFTSSQSLARLSGSLAPDLVELGSKSSEPMLVAIEAGGSLYTGGNAAGRRVQLPWGGSPSVAPVNLHANGLTILQRALAWGSGLGGTSTQTTVVAGSDDAEQHSSYGIMYIDSSDLELADDIAEMGQLTDIVGIRFANVAVPQGAAISAAHIQFQVDELDSGAASLLIQGEASDNAATFTTASYNITSRSRTSASVEWFPPPWTTVGEQGPDQRTTDLSPVIQEIVNRPGWSSGNALAVIISGSGTRTAEAFEGEPAGAPRLQIQFEGGGGGDGGGGGPANFGFDSVFSNSQNGVRRRQIATQVTMPAAGTVSSITAYVGGNNSEVRYAIYTDVGGEPGALVAQTPNASATDSMAWLTIDLPATSLSAGTYWLALSFHDDGNAYRYEGGGQTRYNSNRATQNGYTSNWGSSLASYSRKISIYATYSP